MSNDKKTTTKIDEKPTAAKSQGSSKQDLEQEARIQAEERRIERRAQAIEQLEAEDEARIAEIEAEEKRAEDCAEGTHLPGCQTYKVAITSENAAPALKRSLTIRDCPDSVEAKRRFILAKRIPERNISDYRYTITATSKA